ncbi:MAG: ATP-binding cassette domain-containing protein [Candidatus Karelsulcia muelleri]
MLKIKNLSVSVKKKQILKNVNLTIKKGEIHVIMGPNGSGKSTIASIIAGKQNFLLKKGEIFFEKILGDLNKICFMKKIIGLISSLCVFAKINSMGFIETPYLRVKDGKVLLNFVLFFFYQNFDIKQYLF